MAPDYLEGFPGFKCQEYYRFSGKPNNAVPTLAFLHPTTPISDGEVLLVASDGLSGWSGVQFVSTMNGLDFGQEGALAVLEVRNDGAAARMWR